MKNGGLISRPLVFTRGLAESALLLEEHDAEAVEARVTQRLSVLGHVHAEATGPARARREEHVLVDDLLRWRAPARRAGRSRNFTRLPTVK